MGGKGGVCTSIVSFDFCDPKTKWQVFFSIFIDIYEKFFGQFWVVEVAGKIHPPLFVSVLDAWADWQVARMNLKNFLQND